MSVDRWIVIPNWRSFQHYRDRSPKWIKTYVELTSDDAYLGLTGNRRAILHGIWLEYALARTCLVLDVQMLARRLQLNVKMADLEALNHAGFLAFSDSAPLAAPEHPASPEKEVREERTSTSTERSRANRTPTIWTCPLCTSLTWPRAQELRDHLENVHWLQGDELEATLKKGTP